MVGVNDRVEYTKCWVSQVASGDRDRDKVYPKAWGARRARRATRRIMRLGFCRPGTRGGAQL